MAFDGDDLEAFALAVMLGRAQPKAVAARIPRDSNLIESAMSDVTGCAIQGDWKSAITAAVGKPGAQWLQSGEGPLSFHPSASPSVSNDVLLSLVTAGLVASASGGSRAVAAAAAAAGKAPAAQSLPPPMAAEQAAEHPRDKSGLMSSAGESHIFSLKEWRATRELRRREQEAWLADQHAAVQTAHDKARRRISGPPAASAASTAAAGAEATRRRAPSTLRLGERPPLRSVGSGADASDARGGDAGPHLDTAASGALPSLAALQAVAPLPPEEHGALAGTAEIIAPHAPLRQDSGHGVRVAEGIRLPVDGDGGEGQTELLL